MRKIELSLPRLAIEASSRIFYVLCSCFFVVCLVGVAVAGTNDVVKFKVVDSGLWSPGSTAAGGRTWWLDNERILFPGNDSFTPDGGPAMKSVWEPRTGKVTSHGEWGGVLCVSPNGEVLWGRQIPSSKPLRWKYFFGPVGSEKPYPPPEAEGYRIDTDHGCGWIKRSKDAPGHSRVYLFGSSYLEEGLSRLSREVPSEDMVRNSNRPMHEYPLTLFVDSTTPGKQMPFSNGGYRAVSVRYAPWRDAYLVSPWNYWKTMPPEKIWWIERGGQLSEVPLPSVLPWPSTGSLSFYGVRKGMLVAYTGNMKSSRDPGAGGLYLVNGNTVQLLLQHAPEGLSISPNGCKAALIHAPNYEQAASRVKPYRTVKMIDFCVEETKQ